MEICSWRFAHGDLLMGICSWRFAHGDLLMETASFVQVLALLRVAPPMLMLRMQRGPDLHVQTGLAELRALTFTRADETRLQLQPDPPFALSDLLRALLASDVASHATGVSEMVEAMGTLPPWLPTPVAAAHVCLEASCAAAR